MNNVIDFNLARKQRIKTEERSSELLRSYPRVAVEQPVVVTLENGKAIEMRSGDVSRDGIKLRTTRKVAHLLHPSGRFITDENESEVDLTLTLPLPGGNLHVSARCRIVRFELISDEEVTFTMRFVHFEGAGKRVVEHFVELAMRPNESMSEQSRLHSRPRKKT